MKHPKLSKPNLILFGFCFLLLILSFQSIPSKILSKNLSPTPTPTPTPTPSPTPEDSEELKRLKDQNKILDEEKKAAEARKAIAQAEKDELAAKFPKPTTTPLEGNTTVDANVK